MDDKDEEVDGDGDASLSCLCSGNTESSVFVNNIIKRRQQLKQNIVCSRVCLPPPKEILATRRLVKTALSMINLLQRKRWLAQERELHHEICLQPVAVLQMIVVWKCILFC